MAREITHPAIGNTTAVKELMGIFDEGEMVARGMVQGHEPWRRFGINATVGTVEEVITNISGKAIPWMPLVAQEVEVVSTDAQDGPGGLGLQTVRILGLDENWDWQEADVTLNGITPVATTGINWIRVLCSYGLTVGTYRGGNKGIVTVQETESPAEEIIAMPVGHSQCASSHWTTARNQQLVIRNWNMQIVSGKVATVHFRYAENANIVAGPPHTGPARVLLEMEGIEASIVGKFDAPFLVPSYTDIWVSGSVTAQTGHVYFEYSGALIES